MLVSVVACLVSIKRTFGFSLHLSNWVTPVYYFMNVAYLHRVASQIEKELLNLDSTELKLNHRPFLLITK